MNYKCFHFVKLLNEKQKKKNIKQKDRKLLIWGYKAMNFFKM